jgi:hypothetical protein
VRREKERKPVRFLLHARIIQKKKNIYIYIRKEETKKKKKTMKKKEDAPDECY